MNVLGSMTPGSTFMGIDICLAPVLMLDAKLKVLFGPCKLRELDLGAPFSSPFSSSE
eukprot:CAMPEP_0180661762 /NCGR_PEP_ID=MMETSP1037_2-20121125/59018_1 /TAXON_ID=632150 /ORGANISM="Azadinium spinosum, Strain 3D9" /LENGTH=56 /DNA_ID=CAMNT_0022689353 /DNA_START=112 /DNA_END=279 /DNA_ORIENTATION=-